MAGYVSAINVYYIKSCGGTTITQTFFDACGLQNDRKWMVVDEDNHFLTQRDMPRMALIQPHVESLRGRRHEADYLIVNAPGMSELQIGFSKKEDMNRAASQAGKVWDDSCRVLDQGDEASAWFSKFLEMPCRLVRAAYDGRWHHSSALDKQFPVNFQDGYPVLIIGQASLDDLNRRLTEPIPMDRFRPNIVVSGVPAYEEDGWDHIRIGMVEMVGAKLCQRCPIPTTNQQTGERGEEPWQEEPLHTLLTYRQVAGGGVVFGKNFVHSNGGYINLGATVETLR